MASIKLSNKSQSRSRKTAGVASSTAPAGTIGTGGNDDDLSAFLLEPQRKSMLDYVDEKREKDGSRKNIFHRLIYTGRHRLKDKHEQFAKYIEKIVKTSTIGVTVHIVGILLVYNDHFVHVVECLYENLLDLIKICCEDYNNEIIEDAVVVLITHDISFHISLLSLEEMQNAVEALVESVRELFPSAVVVGCFMKLRLMTATQFVKTFRVPSDLVLDEEVVWPMMTNPYPLEMNKA
uniref:Uncharacterized protein n=1 Tax=Strigamia maritima TaxID=126957 RepID=T1JDQ8_STRMM